MNKNIPFILFGMILPVAVFAGNEGVPSYYQTNNGVNANRAAYSSYQQQGYTNYVGTSGQKQVVGSRSYSYQVPVANNNAVATAGTITANGIAMPIESEKRTSLYAMYGRRFADFEFETGVNSILEWDDMVFNEITAGLRHTFTLGKFDLGVYGEYTYGTMSHGGLSMDYDLKPYFDDDPTYGIFTVSVGDEAGKTHHIDFGISAHHVWDIGGWKFSPRIGYEIFKHNLRMSDHYYPNPGVYLPLMTSAGNYVFASVDDTTGLVDEYFAVPQNQASSQPDNYYQVCLSPSDIKLVDTNTVGSLGNSIGISDYNSSFGTLPWGVDETECVIIGGDGPILVGGTTHMYDTTWSGFYLGLEIEKQMTLSDKLRFYVQFGLPKYSSEGTWPYRTDWQQDPSFLDEGRNGSYSYKAELEYDLQLSDRLQLALKVDTNCYHVGKIDGEQYWAEETIVYKQVDEVTGEIIGYAVEIIPASTEHVSEAIRRATWQSFGLYAGLKFSF